MRGGQRLRQRGPAPVLLNTEVLTIEVVGEYLGLAQDKALSAHVRRRHAALFSGLAAVHRTTFGQLVERAHAKRVRARDFGHLSSRLLRKVLSHTVAVLLHHSRGNPPLQLARLIP